MPTIQGLLVPQWHLHQPKQRTCETSFSMDAYLQDHSQLLNELQSLHLSIPTWMASLLTPTTWTNPASISVLQHRKHQLPQQQFSWAYKSTSHQPPNHLISHICSHSIQPYTWADLHLKPSATNPNSKPLGLIHTELTFQAPPTQKPDNYCQVNTINAPSSLFFKHKPILPDPTLPLLWPPFALINIHEGLEWMWLKTSYAKQRLAANAHCFSNNVTTTKQQISTTL